MAWVSEYLVSTHGKKRANEILDEIDQRYVDLFLLAPLLSHDSYLLELPLCLCFLGSETSLKGATLHSGQAMTQRDL